MFLPLRRLGRLSSMYARFDTRGAARLTVLLMPILLGLLSLRLGQDDNWDLKNYHLYNPFAFLSGKIGVDLAPGQWQSYFNPTLDLLYYSLVTALPAPLAGFLMGVLHGLNFLLVVGIARQVLPAAAPQQGYRAPLFLAFAGTLGAAFQAQLGNSMGDNMTALLVLGALLVVLRQWECLAAGDRAGVLSILGAGLLMGLGCGLKLTNATYALALCLSLLSLPVSMVLRLGMASLFGVGVLAGIGVSAGHWFVLMANTFGNPLFPQFNSLFLAPLAAPIGIGDTGWLPRSLLEKIVWPFIIAIDSRRVGELQLRLWMWPLLYLALLAMAVKGRMTSAAAPSSLARRQRLLLLFFALGYVLWLNLFAIYRYLVPLELLLPLVLWLAARRLFPSSKAAPVLALLIAVAVAACIPRVSWGHAKWSRKAFSAEVPGFAQPAQSMVFTVHGDPPMGWLVTRFPSTLAFVSLGSGFPESSAYAAKVKQMAAQRSGPLFVMLQADRTAPTASRSAAQTQQASAANQLVLARATEVLGRYGFTLDAASCTAYPAFIGKTRWDYQLCRINEAQGTRR